MDAQALSRELADYKNRLSELEEHCGRLRTQMQALQGDTIHDLDTSLHSLAYFHTRLKEEIVRSERYRHFLSLVLIHVELRDRQSTGQITREIGRMGQEMIGRLSRRNDVVALYSKRQMVLLLPETDPRGARLFIQRVLAAFPDNGRRITYSILSYPNDATHLELIMSQLQERSENLFRGQPQLQE